MAFKMSFLKAIGRGWTFPSELWPLFLFFFHCFCFCQFIWFLPIMFDSAKDQCPFSYENEENKSSCAPGKCLIIHLFFFIQCWLRVFKVEIASQLMTGLFKLLKNWKIVKDLNKLFSKGYLSSIFQVSLEHKGKAIETNVTFSKDFNYSSFWSTFFKTKVV